MSQAKDSPPQDVEKRRDDALRRALTTPPKPHKPTTKLAKAPDNKPGAK